MLEWVLIAVLARKNCSFLNNIKYRFDATIPLKVISSANSRDGALFDNNY